MFFFFEQPEKGLDDYAFLYTVSMKQRGMHKTNCVRFMMSTEDAMEWCSSSISKGQLHGNPWMYLFVRAKDYFDGVGKKHRLDLRKMFDNGKWDEKINAMGLKKYGKEEIKEILAPLGIEVLI